jgi:hypothetical protein
MLAGAGQATFQSPNNSALMGSAPREQQGVASGFLATGRSIGQSISVALTGAIFVGLGGAQAGATMVNLRENNSIMRISPTVGIYLNTTFTHAFQVTFLVCAAIAFLGVFTSLVRGKERRAG